jgi:hypothetical protein
MHFGTVFQRQTSAFGADSIPTFGDEGTVDQLQSDLPKGQPFPDCVHNTRLVNINGYPAQRLVMGCFGPTSEATADLQADFYMLEELSGYWFKLDASSVALTLGQLVYVDHPTMGDFNQGKVNGKLAASKGQPVMEVYVVVTIASGSPTAGVYTFTVGTDFSNPTP